MRDSSALLCSSPLPPKHEPEVRKTHPGQGKIHQEFTFPGRRIRKFGVLVGHLITEWRLVDGVDVGIDTFDWWSWKKAQIPDDIRQNSLSSTSGPCYPVVHSKQMPFWGFFICCCCCFYQLTMKGDRFLGVSTAGRAGIVMCSSPCWVRVP